MLETLESFVTVLEEAEPAEYCNVCGLRSTQIGVPCSCRWPVWTSAVRPWELHLPMSYEDLLRDKGPEDRQIELDIGRTFPNMRAFDIQKEQKLSRVLRAYAALRPDVGYCQGMNFVAGLLTLASDREEDAFKVLVCLMDRYKLQGMYQQSFPLLWRCVNAADRLLLLNSPLLHKHLKEEGLQPYLYMHEWFLSLFVDCMPPALVLDIFDAIMQEGLFIIVRLAVAVLCSLEGTLLTLEFEGMFRCLKATKCLQARQLQNVVDRARAMEVPREVLAYLNGDSEGIAELPLEAEQGGSGWMQAIGQAFSNLSPRKRRMRKALERTSPQKSVQGSFVAGSASTVSSPRKRPSLAAASPCGFSTPPRRRPSLATASPCARSPTVISPFGVVISPFGMGTPSPRGGIPREESCHSAESIPEEYGMPSKSPPVASGPASPSKCARLRASPEREAEGSSPHRSQVCARRRQSEEHSKPLMLPLEVMSPSRKCCPSSSSPSKRSCSGSPVKALTCAGSPVKTPGAWARMRT